MSPSPIEPVHPASDEAATVSTIRVLVADVLHRRNFYVGRDARIEVIYLPVEEVFWEVFEGRLLDTPLTKTRRKFETWGVFLGYGETRPPEPTVAVRFDAATGEMHVTRAIQCHAWEGYHAGEGVYLSREIRKWVRERVGTISVGRFASMDEIRDELATLVFQAVVGTSRLPLTSIEAPLPAFSLGEVGYAYRPEPADQEPIRSEELLVDEALSPARSKIERAKLLETVLRATPAERLPQVAEMLLGHIRTEHARTELLVVLRTMFNEVALSPYTDFVDKTLALVDAVERRGGWMAAEVVDFLGHLLRQQGRHLTAYDLVTFHHRGANYPDALLLDAVLKAYLKRVQQRPEQILDDANDGKEMRRAKRLRRRALRQGWLARTRYEGHPVPDAPTSEGENLRVLPGPFERVPDEQIVQVHRRRKRLFAGDPLTGYVDKGGPVLKQSILDLRCPDEVRELGMALFLDRPLGIGKAPLEPDGTLLLSYDAFSRSIAKRRLRELAAPKLLDEETREALRVHLESIEVRGVNLSRISPPSRRALVSLDDVRKVADDFVLLRTTRRSADEFRALFDWSPIAGRPGTDCLADGRRVLIVQGVGPCDELTIFDAALQPRLRCAVDVSEGYESRGGVEYPKAGLRVRLVGESTDAAASEVTIRPKATVRA
jgi:hypothetical protein